MKKLLALLLMVALAFSSLTGCTPKTETPPSQETNQNGDKPTDEGYGVLREAETSKIGSLNPLTYTASYSSTHINRCSVKLYNYFPNEAGDFVDLKGELALEEPVAMNPEKTLWQIKIRENVTWENGDVLDADDVMYTWKMMLDPKLANIRAGNFAKDFIEIKNAEAYYTQKPEAPIAWETVGLKKIDNLTVEIATVSDHSPTEVMMHLSHPANCVVNEEYFEKYMNADRTETLYGTSADKWISSGAFLVESWVNDAEIKYKKNPNYIFKDTIWLAGIHTKVVGDSGTQMQLFENGEIDYVKLTSENYKKYEQDPRVLLAPSNSVRHMVVNAANPNKPILANENFRKALYFAMDRAAIASLTKQTPADYIVPTTHIVDTKSGVKFRDTEIGKANVRENYSYDPILAKEYFDKAMAEEGLTTVSISLLYADSELYTQISEYVQQSIPAIFGKDKFELKLQAMPSAQLSAHRNSWTSDPTVYELSWAGWVSSDLAPWNAFKYWTTYYPNKNEPYFSKDFDTAFNRANFGVDRFEPGVREQLTGEMERLLLEPAVIIPFAQDIDKFMKQDRVELTMKNWANRVEFGWQFAKVVE